MSSQENERSEISGSSPKNDRTPASPPSRSVGWLPPHYSALMNGSDTYQRNERCRRDFQEILAADRAKAAAAGNPPGTINIPFFVGMGLGLGLNILGYFAFKAYFRSFLDSVTSFRGQRANMRRTGFHDGSRSKPKENQQPYWKHKGFASNSESTNQRNAGRKSTGRSNASSSSQDASRAFQKSRDERHKAIRERLHWLEMPLTKLNPSVAEIKTAYRRISLKTHPDVARGQCGTRAESKDREKELQEKFMQATAAHDELLKILHGK